MNLSAPFIYRPVMTTFVMLAVVIAGWLSFAKLPVSDLPTVEQPEVEIVAGYVGADPETVLNQLTIPLENELSHVKGVEEMVSVSSAGRTVISLKFSLGKDMDGAIRDIQAAINRAETHMPRDMSPRPYYRRQQGSQDPIMYVLLVSNTVSLGDLRNYADTFIIPRLSRLEGVAQVTAFGEKKTVKVRVNPEMMAARGIGFNQIVESIGQYTKQMPMGSIQTGGKVLAIELFSRASEVTHIENIEVSGTGIKLKDIAEVVEKSPDSVDFHYLTRDNRSLALILGVQKISDANTVAVSDAVKRVLNEASKELPPTIKLNVWFDKAVWIHESILDVEWSLVIAFALVVAVIYFSLGRLSEAIIPSIALPLSLVGTFAAMYLLDFSIDLLSLLALTLSVGFVVDDAIVVLENIVRHQEAGEPILEASLKGSKQICFTVVSMTLSLVAVFIPLLFMPGMTGLLFREFSMTLAVAILVSGFISLTLTPMLCSRFLSKKPQHNRLQKKVTAANKWLVGLYAISLRWCLRHATVVLLVAVSCMAVTVPLFMELPVRLVPPEDRGFFFSFVNLPKGVSHEEVKRYQKELETLFQNNENVESFLDIYVNGRFVLAVRLKPAGNRLPQDKVIAGITKELDAIPGIVAFTQGYSLINLDLEFGADGQYRYIVRGIDYQDVDKATQELAKKLQQHPSFAFVQPPRNNDTPKLAIHVNDEKANRLGLSRQQIQGLLQSAFGQNEVATLQKGTTTQKVYLGLAKGYQDNIEAVSKIYLSPSIGELIPLKSVVDWEEILGFPSRIQRDQLPSLTISFSLKEGVSLRDAMRIVEEVAGDILPPTVSGGFHGSSLAAASTVNQTLLLLLAASVVMYIVLGILYESFIHPLTILSSIPFAGLGGVLTLFLFKEPLSIFSAVGFLLLIGIVKKNGIMMIDCALDNQKSGMDAEESIFRGCLVRFRPIMMTTVAAIMGAVPIAVGYGDGSEARCGLGLVIVGGLLFSQLLTLYVTPVIFLTLSRLRKPSKAASIAV